MSNKVTAYHRPATLAEASELLLRGGGRAVPLVHGPRIADPAFPGAEAVVDLAGLALDGIAAAVDGGLRLGGLTALQDLAESRAVQAYAGGVLAEAAHLAGGLGLRQVASLAGALSPMRGSDGRWGPPEVRLALLALGAEVEVAGEGGEPTTYPLAQHLAAVEPRLENLVIAVRLPPTQGAAGLSRVARSPRDEALVAAAAWVMLDHGSVRRVRLAVAAGNSPAQLMPQAEQVLVGRALRGRLEELAAKVTAALEPPGDYRASAEYLRAMSGVVARRALEQAERRAAQAAPAN